MGFVMGRKAPKPSDTREKEAELAKKEREQEKKKDSKQIKMCPN
jgi:hypothetical protein